MTRKPQVESAKKLDDAFGFFTEIGIIHQLAKTLLESELPDGLKMIHFSVLNNLSRRGDGRLPSDLAQTFQVPRSHMTDVLAVLEKSRYIRFEASKKDKRSKLIYITEKGHLMRRDAISSSRKPLKELSKRFDLNRLTDIHTELIDLRKIMDAMRSK